MVSKPQQNQALNTNVLLAPQSGDNFLKISAESAGESTEVQTRNPKVLLAPQSGYKETQQKPEIYPKSKTKAKEQQTL